MSKFADAATRRLRRWFLPALATLAAAPIAAVLAADENGRTVTAALQAQAATAKAAPAPKAATPGYNLRCWQYGRLILEENTRDAPPESALDVLRLQDRSGGLLLLLETANATCMLKAAPPAAAGKSIPR